jgi:CRP-like cAMP-binding protein
MARCVTAETAVAGDPPLLCGRTHHDSKRSVLPTTSEPILLETSGNNARPIARRLSNGTSLSADADAALRTLCRKTTAYPADREILTDAETDLIGLTSGWACRQRLSVDGRRQIFSFLLPGDLILPACDVAWTAMTSLVALTPVRTVSFRNPEFSRGERIASPLWAALSSAADLEVTRLLDHILRLGCQNAQQRVLHLLHEFDSRLAEVGLSEGGCFALPLQQAVLADALGLSNVHINRTLQQMRYGRMIETTGRRIRLLRA